MLRIILIILVVIGHSTYYTVITPFGGIDYAKMMENAGVEDALFHIWAKHLTSFIYSFHMPAFMAMSGSIYYIRRCKGAYNDFVSLACNKAKRLLIPLIVVWLLWNFPLKYLTGYYVGVSPSKWFIQILCPSSVYLWFLESLFFVYLIFYMLERLSNKAFMFCLIMFLYLIGVLIFIKYGRYHFLGNPFYYLLWFYCGVIFEKNRARINTIITYWKAIVITLFGAVFFIMYEIGVNKYVSLVLKHVILPVLFIVLLYYFVWNRKVLNLQVIERIASYSMGIYLYAEPLNYLILFAIYTIMGITSFGDEGISFLIWLIRNILTTIIAIMITSVLKRLKFKYLY